MSLSTTNPARHGLARQLWSAWIRFGSPVVSVDSPETGASDRGNRSHANANGNVPRSSEYNVSKDPIS